MESRVSDMVLRFAVVLLALLQPLIIVLCFGVDVHSISAMWLTYLQPLFIVTNAATSYLLFSIRRWRIPSLFLLLLTAFSVQFSMLSHNIFAGIFFVSCVYSLYGIKRLRWYIIPYVCSALVLLVSSIFWAEVAAVIVICAYHFNLLVGVLKIRNKKRG